MKQVYDAKTAASITALARRIMVNNLCKEIVGVQPMTGPVGEIFTIRHNFAPESKYKFSRANWYVVEFDDRYYFEVDAWCAEQFGPHPTRPDAWSRWVHKYENKIHFRDANDAVLFKLRWGA